MKEPEEGLDWYTRLTYVCQFCYEEFDTEDEVCEHLKECHELEMEDEEDG
jgi:hypothetical protein